MWPLTVLFLATTIVFLVLYISRFPYQNTFVQDIPFDWPIGGTFTVTLPKGTQKLVMTFKNVTANDLSILTSLQMTGVSGTPNKNLTCKSITAFQNGASINADSAITIKTQLNMFSNNAGSIGNPYALWQCIDGTCNNTLQVIFILQKALEMDTEYNFASTNA